MAQRPPLAMPGQQQDEKVRTFQDRLQDSSPEDLQRYCNAQLIPYNPTDGKDQLTARILDWWYKEAKSRDDQK